MACLLHIKTGMTTQTGQKRVLREKAFLSTLPNCDAWSDTLTGKVCGRFLEVYKTINLQRKGEDNSKVKASAGTPETPEETLNRSIARSRTRIRQLTNTNELTILHTLTFAVEHPVYFKGEKMFVLVPIEQQKNRENVLKLWRRFSRKMRIYEGRKGRTFAYIAVIERHTGKRAGADSTIKTDTYHIHFLSDKIHGKRLMQAKWTHGFCNFADWNKGTKDQDMATGDNGTPVDNPGAYASKYVGKDMEGEYAGRKRYWASKNLKQPYSIHGEDVRALMYGNEPIYTQKTEIEHEGKIYYQYRYTFALERGADDIQTDEEKKAEIRSKEQRKRIVARVEDILAAKKSADFLEEKYHGNTQHKEIKRAFIRKQTAF